MNAPQVIPWWAPATPECVPPPTSWRDYWDALFGRLEQFQKVELDGSWFICEAGQVWDWIGLNDEGDDYVISTVLMTRRQFESLPEFEGF